MTLPQMFGIVVEYEAAAPQTFLVVNDPVDGWQMRAVTAGANACEVLWSMNVDPNNNEVWGIDRNASPTAIYKSTDLGETWIRVVTTGLDLHDMFAQKTLMESPEGGVPFTLYRSGDGVSWAPAGPSTHGLEWGWHMDSISGPDGAGRVHWVYEDPSRELYYARSTDNGLNIETPVYLGQSARVTGWRTRGIAVKDNWVYIIYIDLLTVPTRSPVYCAYSDDYGAAGSWTIRDLIYTSNDDWAARGVVYDSTNYFVSTDGASVYIVIGEYHVVSPFDERVKIWKAPLGGSWSLTHTETFPTDDWSIYDGIAPPTWVGPNDPPMAYAVRDPDDPHDIHIYCNDTDVLTFNNNDYPLTLYPVLVGSFHKAPKAGVWIM